MLARYALMASSARFARMRRFGGTFLINSLPGPGQRYLDYGLGDEALALRTMAAPLPEDLATEPFGNADLPYQVRPGRFVGGRAPGDVVEFVPPDIACVGELLPTWEWFLGGGSTGNTSRFFLRPENTGAVTIEFSAQGGAFTRTYTAPPTLLAVVTPVLTPQVGAVRRGATFTRDVLAADQAANGETLSLAEARVEFGPGVLTWDPEGRLALDTAGVTADAETTVHYTATNGSGTATATLGVLIRQGFPIVANTLIEAEALDRNAFYQVREEAGRSGGAYVQNHPDTATPGLASGVFGAVDGVYDILVNFRTEEDGPASLKVRVGEIEVDAWNTSGSNGVYVDREIPGVSIAYGDVIELEGKGALGAWAAVDHLRVRTIAGQTDQSKPKLLVSTDLGGDDKDDAQSYIHLLLHLDRIDFRGLVTTSTDEAGVDPAPHVTAIHDA